MNPAIYEEINNPPKWNPRMAEPCSRETIRVFQKGLDRIFGTRPGGLPLVRIVWAQDFEKTKTFNRYSKEWYPSYLSHVNEWAGQDVAGQPTIRSVYVAAPRYIIEGWRAPELDYADLAMAETERVVAPDEDGKEQLIRADSFTAAVGEQWEEIFRLAVHDHNDPKQSYCCQWNEMHGYECWGYFRVPTKAHLDHLEYAYKQMQEVFDTGPTMVRTEAEKARHFARRMDELTKAKQYRRDQISRELSEFWKSKFANPNQPYKEAVHGPYHFLNSNKGTLPLWKPQHQQ
jgi:hypothetical protein